MRRVLGHAALLTLVACIAPSAFGTELGWSAPPGCTQDTFVAKLEDTIDQPLEELSVQRISIAIEQGPTSPQSWRLALSFDDTSKSQQPERTILGTSCEDVSRAAAVAVAMALHDELPAQPAPPAGKSRDTSSTPSPEVNPEALTKPPGPDTHQPSSAPQTREWRVPVQVFASIDGAIQGVPSIGAGVGVGLSLARFSAGLRGVYLPPITVGQNTGVELQSAWGIIDACWDFASSGVRPRVCLGYEAGAVLGRGSGPGLRASRQKAALWHAVKPEVGLVVDLTGNWSFGFSIAGAFALTEANFVFDQGRVAHELPGFSLRGNAGLGFSF